MKQRQETLTVTLHWHADGREQRANIVCEDGPPDELVPLLLAGCGLPAVDARGAPRRYALRAGSATGRPLRPGEPATAQGVASGGHLWLTEHGAEPAWRCVLSLPDGGELLVPRAGVELTRGWLLQGLALLNPETYRSELTRLERRESVYRFVSSRPHCRLAPAAGGAIAVGTERSDVVTLLNGAQVVAGRPTPIRDGDRLTLGEGGLVLGMALLSE